MELHCAFDIVHVPVEFALQEAAAPIMWVLLRPIIPLPRAVARTATLAMTSPIATSPTTTLLRSFMFCTPFFVIA
jgi:hypothetical protein